MKKITYLLAFLLTGSALAQEDCNLQYDGNGDGAVNVEDVLGVLSEFGEVCEPVIEYGPCGPDSTVSYHGYDYSLVEIGEQCWFAENLRTELYGNGDIIPYLSDTDWANLSLQIGSQAFYDTDSTNLELYGRLYNFKAVEDERGLCPNDWHVPSHEEWMQLEMALGMSEEEANTQGFSGTDQGTQMKTTFGWNQGGNGTNTSGFSGLPGGLRWGDGTFTNAGNQGKWWSTTNNAYYNPYTYWTRSLEWNAPEVGSVNGNVVEGLSVRCLKD